MNITQPVQPGQQLRPGILNQALRAAATQPFDPRHDAVTVIVDFDPVDQPAFVAAIAAHLATDWAAQEAAAAQRAAGLDASFNASSIVQTLKPMDNAAFNAWWAANVTTIGQAGLILREVVKYIVRRI